MMEEKRTKILTTLVSIWADQYGQEIINLKIGVKDEEDTTNTLTAVSGL